MTNHPVSPNGSSGYLPDIASKRRVLLVDDGRDTIESMWMMFALNECAVRHCRAGSDTVSTALAFRPHLIALVVDRGLDRTGIECITRIRAEPTLNGVIVSVIAGWTSKSDRARAMAAGADCYFVRPDEIGALVKVVLSIERRHGRSAVAPPEVERRGQPSP